MMVPDAAQIASCSLAKATTALPSGLTARLRLCAAPWTLPFDSVWAGPQLPPAGRTA